jgi:hypothetical protein
MRAAPRSSPLWLLLHCAKRSARLHCLQLLGNLMHCGLFVKAVFATNFAIKNGRDNAAQPVKSLLVFQNKFYYISICRYFISY